MEDNPIIKAIFDHKKVEPFARKLGLCPDIDPKDPWFVQGNITELPYYMVEFAILPCSLPNPADCITDPLSLSLFYMQIVNVQSGIDANKFKDPIQKIPSTNKIIQIHKGLAKYDRYMMR